MRRRSRGRRAATTQGTCMACKRAFTWHPGDFDSGLCPPCDRSLTITSVVLVPVTKES